MLSDATDSDQLSDYRGDNPYLSAPYMDQIHALDQKRPDTSLGLVALAAFGPPADRRSGVLAAPRGSGSPVDDAAPPEDGNQSGRQERGSGLAPSAVR